MKKEPKVALVAIVITVPTKQLGTSPQFSMHSYGATCLT
jgi:hypothetical protein